MDSKLETGTKVLAQLKAIRKEVYLRDSSIRQGNSIPVFHPESLLRLSWDLILIFFILYQAFFVPLSLCFPLPDSHSLRNFEMFSVSILLLDIRKLYLAVNFNTGFYAKGSLVTARLLVIKQYAKGWFWVDFMSSFPFTWIANDITPAPPNPNDSSGYLLLFRLFRFLRILRLLRLAKLKSLTMKLEAFIASDSVADWFHMLRLVAFMCLMGHWIACWWYFIGAVEALTQESSWTTNALTLAEDYVTALYYAFTTMTTVGYGDVTPVTTNERLFATSVMVLSCCLQAYIIGSIGILVSKHNAHAESYRKSVLSLNQYMKRNSLPAELQYRVRRFLEYLWEQRKEESFNEKEVLEALSDPLRNEVYGQVNGAVVYLCPIFKEFDPNFVSHIGKLLKSETFAQDDIVFEGGHLGGKIYYIMRGMIDIYHQETASSFQILQPKTCFGEISFFLGVPRCASSRCIEFAELLTLDRYEVEPLLSQYPEAREYFRVLSLRVQSSHDLSALHIRCYICTSLGHVASTCHRSVLNYGHEETKEKWLRNRFIRTKYINKILPPIPNHARKDKRAKHVLSAKHVLGFPRGAGEMYPEDPNLLPRITEYEETYERDREKHTITTGDLQTDAAPNSAIRRKKTNYSFVYKDSFDSVEDSTFLNESLEDNKPPTNMREFHRSVMLARQTNTQVAPSSLLSVPLGSQPTISPRLNQAKTSHNRSKISTTKVYPLLEKSTRDSLDPNMTDEAEAREDPCVQADISENPSLFADDELNNS